MTNFQFFWKSNLFRSHCVLVRSGKYILCNKWGHEITVTIWQQVLNGFRRGEVAGDIYLLFFKLQFTLVNSVYIPTRI